MARGLTRHAGCSTTKFHRVWKRTDHSCLPPMCWAPSGIVLINLHLTVRNIWPQCVEKHCTIQRNKCPHANSDTPRVIFSVQILYLIYAEVILVYSYSLWCSDLCFRQSKIIYNCILSTENRMKLAKQRAIERLSHLCYTTSVTKTVLLTHGQTI